MLSRRNFLGATGTLTALAWMDARLLSNTLLIPSRVQSASNQQGPLPDPALLQRAVALLQDAPLIDTHNDLPSMLLELHGDLAKYDLGKIQPGLCADIPRLRQGGVGAQYWSVFVESATQRTHTSVHESLREFDVALRLIRSQPDFEQARTADDIERIHKAGRIACLLGVEGGHMMENSPAALRIFHELGARYMTLTHWDNIDWADSATDRPEHYGLTGFGKQVVREMNRLGMFVDISHVSADTMRDALGVSRAPVICSHSSAFAIDPHPRNVPDDVLQKIAANRGVVHVNFINEFISPRNPVWQQQRTEAVRELHAHAETDEALEKGKSDWEQKHPFPRPTISDVAAHIDHIRQVAGIDHIGIGADFYDAGNKSMAEGLDDVTRYPYLFAELLRRRYSDDDVRKIAGRNHLRAMRQMEQVAAELQKSEGPLLMEGMKRAS
ncbi:MAG: dipeptidase [Terriglobales bacterium]